MRRSGKDEIVLVYRRAPQKTSEIKEAIGQDLDKLKQYLAWIAEDVAKYNDALETLADQHVSARRNKALNDREHTGSRGDKPTVDNRQVR